MQNRHNPMQSNDFQDFSKGQSTIVQLRELQVTRRLRFLNDQRRKREEQWSYLRDLKRIVPHIDITRDSENDNFRWEMSKNIMMSEWMMEEPDDLEDFILVPCPKGIRGTLLFEPQENKRNQLAKVYGKTGHKLLEVRTNIPADTMLDIVYVKKNKTIYILDCMKYAGRDLTNCDTAFRRYWIGSKFFECRLGVIDIRVPNNNLKLNFIEGYDFNMPHRVHHCFQRIPCFDDCAELDGFLFYHKDGSYTPGESPLVLWLFPYMIDEVLTMFRVHPDYNSFKPDNYTNYIEHIEKFNQKKNEKKEKRFKNKKQRVEKNYSGQLPGSSNSTSFEDDNGKRKCSDKFYEN